MYIEIISNHLLPLPEDSRMHVTDYVHECCEYSPTGSMNVMWSTTSRLHRYMVSLPSAEHFLKTLKFIVGPAPVDDVYTNPGFGHGLADGNALGSVQQYGDSGSARYVPARTRVRFLA